MGQKVIKPLLVACVFTLYNRLIGRCPGYGLRLWYLRQVLRLEIAPDASIHMDCFFTGKRIRIGSRTVINRRCYLDGRGGLEIGEDVSVSAGTAIISLTHDALAQDFPAVEKPVKIGDKVWIGFQAIILPGKHIGEGAVIGAGSVVSRTVEPYSIAVGNPLRVIGKRPGNLKYSLHYRPWFDTDIQ